MNSWDALVFIYRRAFDFILLQDPDFLTDEWDDIGIQFRTLIEQIRDLPEDLGRYIWYNLRWSIIEIGHFYDPAYSYVSYDAPTTSVRNEGPIPFNRRSRRKTRSKRSKGPKR